MQHVPQLCNCIIQERRLHVLLHTVVLSKGQRSILLFEHAVIPYTVALTRGYSEHAVLSNTQLYRTRSCARHGNAKASDFRSDSYAEHAVALYMQPFCTCSCAGHHLLRTLGCSVHTATL